MVKTDDSQVNDATLNALEYYLDESSHTSASSFRRLALNNCGINGREAARLFLSLANHPEAHLHLNGNPLEDGIDDLCRAIAKTPGPLGLHIDMVEFRHEANFIALMKSLSANTNIIFLSMAGTAPTPSSDGPCGSEVCQALEDFFRDNKSVRFLDLSGYSGKLDEGQLGKGFARSLRGLTSNTTLTHLRIRNQNLHDDVGTLGVVIRQNRTLRMIDCQENNWNLTSIQFLSKSLKLSNSIVEFPFPQAEYERALRRVVADIRRQASAGSSSGSSSKAASASMYVEQESVLRTALQRQVRELRETVVRNREALEAANGPFAMDLEESGATGGERGWPSLEMKIPSTNNSSVGSTAGSNNPQHTQPAPLKPPHERRTSLHVEPPKSSPVRLLDYELDADLMETPIDRPTSEMTRRGFEAPSLTTVRSTELTVANGTENPYHIGLDATALLLLETPPGGASPEEAGGRSPVEEPETPVTPTASTSGSEEAGETPSSPEFLLISTNSKSAAVDNAARQPSYSANFDMGPYFTGSGRDFVISRFRLGGLEAHEEE